MLKCDWCMPMEKKINRKDVRRVALPRVAINFHKARPDPRMRIFKIYEYKSVYRRPQEPGYRKADREGMRRTRILYREGRSFVQNRKQGESAKMTLE